MKHKREEFGTKKLTRLLFEQAMPASIGILVLSIYGIVDTIFVGRWVGHLGIAAITVVLPITFFISSIGMSIGVGGASIISRAFGKDNDEKAYRTFGNQVLLTLILSVLFVVLGFTFMEPILKVFGGRGEALVPAEAYFKIILIGVPFLAWSMMSNNVIRAEGYPKIAMLIMVIPAVFNIILDPIFIVWLDMGIEGAAYATTISYMASAVFALWFFTKGKSQMQINSTYLIPDFPILKEIGSLGSVTLARQGTISILAIVLNNSLFNYGGELGLSTYGIINRVLMFANFPVLGITQGFVPIVGFNFGAGKLDRVKSIIKIAMTSASGLAFIIFAAILLFAPSIISVFTNDNALIDATSPAIRKVFLATPLLAISLLGSAYFQAVGKAFPALILSLSKQGFLLIPLVLILPIFFGLDGIWYAFPMADVGAASLTLIYLRVKGPKFQSDQTIQLQQQD